MLKILRLLLPKTSLHLKVFIFVNIYRPPHTILSTFCDDISSLLEIIVSLPSPTIICGDFKIHIDTISSSSDSCLKLLQTWNMKQHINFPTHIHGHTLDFLITQTDFHSLKSFNYCDTISDHFCISVYLENLGNFTLLNNSGKTISYRKFNEIDTSKLKADLTSSDLIVNPATTANELYTQYHETLTSLLEKHAPMKTRKVTSKPCIFTTDELLRAKRTKRRLERVFETLQNALNRSKF